MLRVDSNRLGAGARGAASMRASVSSRPSAATDSKIPARRWCLDRDADRLEDLARLQPTPLDDAAQRLLDLLGPERLRSRLEALRAAQALRRAVHMTFDQAFSS